VLSRVRSGPPSLTSRSAIRAANLCTLSQRPDQGMFLGVAQMVEVGKLQHALVGSGSTTIVSRNFFRGLNA
jgi:hypothetical protein